jgi:hypothetical protein
MAMVQSQHQPGPAGTLPPPPRGRRRKQRRVPDQAIGGRWIESLEPHLARLRQAYHHPNRVLFYDDWFVAHLLAFYNPVLDSLRMIEDASRSEVFAEHLDVPAVCRSTNSDASRVFDPQLLGPILQDLKHRLPQVTQSGLSLGALTKQVIAADGSLFTIAASVAWALHLTKTNGKPLGQVRLDLQLDVLRWLPQALHLSGQGDGSESKTLAQRILPGVIYLIDRYYVDFELMKVVIAADSDFVLRAKCDSPHFVCTRELALSPEDRAHGIISDRIGYLPGSRGAQAPEQPIREVVILNAQSGQTVRLLTTLLEVPACVIGHLYRHRWQIELFFRWLKVWTNMEHLYAHSRNGLTLQFYVAVIAVLLMYSVTGRRVSKYAYGLLHWVPQGKATLEQVLPILERREQAAERDRARQAARRAAKTSV